MAINGFARRLEAIIRCKEPRYRFESQLVIKLTRCRSVDVRRG